MNRGVVGLYDEAAELVGICQVPGGVPKLN